MGPGRRSRAAFGVSLALLLVALTLAPSLASAQGNGTIWMAQGAGVPVFFNFSVTGQTFVATILTFGNGGNGRWFASDGSTDGVNGNGQILLPAGFSLSQPQGSSIQFKLDGAGASGGTFTIKGLEAFLSISSGRFVRIFP